MYGNFGRRSPSPLRNQVGSLRRGGTRLVGGIPPPPPPPPSEPERDEAFVQETGIKLFTSMPSRTFKRMDENSGGDTEEDEEEDDEQEENEEDDPYEFMDDAIIEEDNEDDEEEDEEEEEEEEEDTDDEENQGLENKSKNGGASNNEGQDNTEACESTKPEILPVKSEISSTNAKENNQLLPSTLCCKSSVNNKSSSGVSSNGSSSGVLHAQVADATASLPPVKIDDAVEICDAVSGSERKPIEAGSEISATAALATPNIGTTTIGSNVVHTCSKGNVNTNSSTLTRNLSSSLKGLNKITSPTSTAAPVSMSAHTTPTKEPADYLFRSKPGRMSLPYRDRYSRPTTLQDGGTSEQRVKEVTLRPARTIWFRRSTKSVVSTLHLL